MGVGPSREKLLEMIKKSSKTNKTENNYKIEFQIDQDNEICGGDEESLDNDSFMSTSHKVKEIKRFPYVAIGTITFKFSSNESNDHTCFLINRKVLVTLSSFLKIGKKTASEVTTTFSEEKLNIKKCQYYNNKDLAVFFLEENSCSQWIGVDKYPEKDEKKNQKIYGDLKVIYSTGKGTKSDIERSNSIPFMDDRNSLGPNNKIFSFLEEIFFDGKKLIIDKNISKKEIIGGVICYKNQQNGGVYAIGVINKEGEPVYFDINTLQFLNDQINNANLSQTGGIDESNIIELDLSKRSIGPSHIKILTEYNLNNLKKLNLLKNQIGPQGAFYLGQSKFSNLEILILNFNEIGDEGIQYLSKGPFLGLKYLYLFHNNISNIGVENILDSIFIDTLLLLDLSDNPNINGDGINIIKGKIQDNNNVLKELLCLNLSGTSINNDASLERLNQIQFPKLKKLILQDIDFSKCQQSLANIIKAKKYDVKTDEMI